MTTNDNSATVNLTDDLVRGFLKLNPDFFITYPELLSKLKAPGKTQGSSIADFQLAMIARLKEDKKTILDLQKELVYHARENMSNMSRIHSAILVLLESEDFNEFVQTITQDFPVLLGVDVTTLVLEPTHVEQIIPPLDYQGFIIAPEGTIKHHLGEDGGYGLLLDNMRGSTDIFGPASGLVRSEALLRLDIGPNAPKGLLAFGSRKPDTFRPDDGIEQISILAQVIERHIRLFL